MNDIADPARVAQAAKAEARPDPTPGIVRPRDAASLILLRGSGDDLELLAGRRPLHMKFMPGVYVFPGGAIDREDGKRWRVEAGGERLPPRLVRCARAALRETWEETGLLVGRRADNPGGADPAMTPVETAYAGHGLVVAIDALAYVGRAITPTPVFRRFNTRFFLADGEHVFGELQSNGEFEDLRWHPIGREKLSPFRDVTQFMLARAIAVRDGTAPPDAPLFCSVRGTRQVRVCREAVLHR